MSWRDQLQSASFRDVPFYTRNTPGEIGRRVAVHEYPLRDDPYPEDLGRKARRYTVDAFVMGDNYMAQRDRIIKALEKFGPGMLVHPQYRRLRVQVLSARPNHSSREGGMCRFSIQFVEAGKNQFPHQKTDTVSGVAQAAGKTITVLEETTELTVLQKASFVMETACDWTNEGVDSLRSINGKIAAFTQPLDDIASGLDSIGDELTTLILTPQTLAAQITNVINGVFSIGNSIQRALDSCEHSDMFALEQLAFFGPAVVEQVVQFKTGMN